MAARKEGTTAKAGPSKAPVEGGSSRELPSGLGDAGLAPAAPEPAKGPTRPTVDGIPVEGLWLHFIGGPVNLIAPGDGTFQFERLYFDKGEYSVEAGYANRIRSQPILSVALTNESLTVVTSKYTLSVPRSRISGNWLTPA